MDGLQNYIKRTNGKQNLTTTVYGFRQLKPKGNRCEYNTAIVPHFVVDLDKGEPHKCSTLKILKQGIDAPKIL